MKRGNKVYEGKAKIVYATDDEQYRILYFKDDATAFDGKKKGTIVEKGILNNRISTTLFNLLAENGIPTHLVKVLSEREALVRNVKIIPVEVVARNIIAGSLAKRMGRPEGEKLPFPIIEYYYKNDSLHDPMINRDHVLAFSLATSEQIDRAREMALKINGILQQFFLDRGILLVDFKLEFGVFNGEVLLADEICPDTCRLWDAESLEKMDKDRFRRDLGKVEDAYLEVCRRVCAPDGE